MRALLLFLAACGFHGKDVPGGDAAPIDVATTDAPPDTEMIDAPATAIDGSTLTCEEKWRNGAVSMTNPIKLAGASGRDPFTNHDENRIYWNKAGVAYQAPLTGVIVGTPKPLSLYVDQAKTMPINAGISKVSTMLGDDVAVMSVSNNGNQDLYLFERISGADFYRDGPISAANTGAQDYDPELTYDGKTLVWAPANTDQQIHMLTRATTGDVFANDTVLAALDGGLTVNHADPSLSDDRQVLLYSTHDSILHYAIFDGAKYVDRGQIPNLHAGVEGDAHLSADLCRVYFGRLGTDGDFDFYVSSVL